jgi:probable phosphoglycerate mutase
VGWDDTIRGSSSRRRARRAGRANSDAERRALAKANAQPARWTSPTTARPGFATLTVDGGARQHPHAAAIGYVLVAADGSPVASHAATIGAVSAVVAEYRALLAGLQHALELGINPIDARSDSKLLVAHLTGERTPSNRKLVALGNEITDLITRIGTVTVSWMPSETTGEAHALVTEALA